MYGYGALAVFLGLVAAVWIGYNVLRIRRERRRPAHPPATDAYDGNLIIPPPGSSHQHGRHADGSGGHAGHGGGSGGHAGHAGGSSGHAGGSAGGHH